MKNKLRAYIVFGIFLIYYGLDGEFVLFYNGPALALGITAFIMAYIEYKNIKKENE